MIWGIQANNVLASQNILSPHVLFALDIVIRRVAEYLVSLIRPGLLLDLCQLILSIDFQIFIQRNIVQFHQHRILVLNHVYRHGVVWKNHSMMKQRIYINDIKISHKRIESMISNGLENHFYCPLLSFLSDNCLD